MNTDSKTTYVEPVGFKGSKGEWILEENKNQYNKWNSVMDKDDNEVASLRSYAYRPTAGEAKEVATADALLISQSKELVKVVQDMLTWKYCFEPRDNYEKDLFETCCNNAKEILKQAGIENG